MAIMPCNSFLAFLDKASQDSTLHEKLNGAVDAEAVASIAHAAGFADVTADQVSAFLAEVSSQQGANSDQELEGVTGGLSKGWKIGLEAVGGAAATGAIVFGAYKSYQWILEKPSLPLVANPNNVVSDNLGAPLTGKSTRGGYPSPLPSDWPHYSIETVESRDLMPEDLV